MAQVFRIMNNNVTDITNTCKRFFFLQTWESKGEDPSMWKHYFIEYNLNFQNLGQTIFRL